MALTAVTAAHAASPVPEPQATHYIECVTTCLDNLMSRGTDRYGPVHTPMLMSIIDVRTGDAPAEPLLLDGMIRAEERPGRRNPGGCDLWDDQPLIGTLYAVSKHTGDSRYADAADAYIRSFCERARKPNGLLAWGSHLFYNAFTDRIDDDRHGDPHEILIHLAEWPDMQRVAPDAVRDEIEGIWTYHVVDKETGLHNRHDDGKPGCDFAFSGGSLVHAFAFMAHQTGDSLWLQRARLVAEHHRRHRNPETGLVPDAPSTGGRYDSTHCFTTVPGPHAAALLRAYDITGDTFFRDTAIEYVKAFGTYGWDARTKRFHAALKLDGTPVPESAKGDGYDVWMPTGHADTWPTTMYSYEFPLAAAQTAIRAYEIAGDDALLEIAQRWALHIRADMPPAIGRRWREEVFAAMPEARRAGGAYAEGYGRAVSFFTRLYGETGDPTDLATALELADEAIAKLYENGWFKGHPAKPYYESTDGVGLLLRALLDLALCPPPR